VLINRTKTSKTISS